MSAVTGSADDKLTIGISSCLLGDKVKADGTHAFDPAIAGVFGLHARWVKVCPEWEMGLGVPREKLRLEWNDGSVHVVSAHAREDVSNQMNIWIGRRFEQLQVERLDAFLLKSGSATCGLQVPVCDERGVCLAETRQGWFADALARHYPLMPVTDEVSLARPLGMTNFVEQIYAVRRLRRMFAREWRPTDIAAFHARHKLLLQARSPASFEELFVTAVTAPARRPAGLREEYEEPFAKAMSKPATPDGHTAVLQKVLSALSPAMLARDYDRLGMATETFRRGRDTLDGIRRELAEKVTLHRIPSLQDQYYLYPEQTESSLRDAAERVLAPT